MLKIIKESSLQIISMEERCNSIVRQHGGSIQEFGYQKYKQCILNILKKETVLPDKGKIMEKTGNIADVILHNIDELPKVIQFGNKRLLPE